MVSNYFRDSKHYEVLSVWRAALERGLFELYPVTRKLYLEGICEEDFFKGDYIEYFHISPKETKMRHFEYLITSLRCDLYNILAPKCPPFDSSTIPGVPNNQARVEEILQYVFADHTYLCEEMVAT